MKNKKDKPLYEKLYETIKDGIISGKIKEGDKLPSKRAFADLNGVSVITASGAYGLLIDEGYVYAKERSGYFVGSGSDKKANYKYGDGEKIEDFAESVDFKFSAFSKIMRKVITEYDRALLVKPPAFGVTRLRKAIAGYLYRYRKMDVNFENIIIGSGSEYFYGMIVALLGRERTYGIESPSYEKIKLAINASGGKTEGLKMGENGILTEELEKTSATVLHVTPFNSYPTGVTANHTKRKEYVTWAKKKNGFIVEDDIDSEFAVGTKPVDTVFFLANGENVIYLNTFSKSLAPSMRMGYMILPDSLVKEYKEKLGFYSCTVPAFDQYVLAEYIDGGYFERHLNRIRRKIKEKKD